MTQHDAAKDLWVEKAILAAVFLRPAVLRQMQALIAERDFASAGHRAVFSAMAKLDASGHGIDLVTVSNALASTGEIKKLPGGMEDLIEINGLIVSSENADSYASIIVEKSRRRQAALLCQKFAPTFADEREDLDETMAGFQTELMGIVRSGSQTVEESHISHVSYRTTERMGKIRNGEIVHVPTGLADLDDALGGGFQETRLYVFGARPGVGKTALAICIALFVAMVRKIPVLFQSIEMTPMEIVLRLMSIVLRIPLGTLETGCKNDSTAWNKVKREWMRIASQMPLFIPEIANPSLANLRAGAQMWRLEKTGGKGTPALRIVDYLQLITAPGGRESNRTQEVGQVSRSLKKESRDLAIPTIAISSLRRQAETKERPSMSDLRESGDIESDADVIMLLYREEMVKRLTADRGVCEGIIAKNRHGKTGTLRFGFDGEHTRFYPLADRSECYEDYGQRAAP